MTLPHCVQPFSKGPVIQRAEGWMGQMQEQLGRRRCPWAVLSMAWLGCVTDTGVKHHRAATGRQTQGTFLISTNAIPTAPSLLGISHGGGGCVQTPSPGAAHDSVTPPRSTLTPGPCDSSPWTLSQMPEISRSDVPLPGAPCC